MDPKYQKFLISALAPEGSFHNCSEIIKWIEERNAQVHVEIKLINFSEMSDWYLDEGVGRIRHKTGKFFSIDGIEVQTSVGPVRSWHQPIINQPEIGFLGCIVKEFDGVLHFLVQAKIEPGNINKVQLSPTLQATRSNYTQQHQGKPPKYLDYFRDASRANVLLDQLQSEQGARFLNKRNRNIIVEVKECMQIDEDFRWLTLGQIKKLLTFDNVINMDLRTVISGIPFDRCSLDSIELCGNQSFLMTHFGKEMFGSATNSDAGVLGLDEIISWLTELKATNDLVVDRVPIQGLSDWTLSQEGISHKDHLYFDVRWASVAIENREVARWNQPIIAPLQNGITAFIIKKIDGLYHFLVQAKIEAGNFDIFEFAPTVQCITGSYKDSPDTVPYLRYVFAAKKEYIRYNSLQSEEGGRFYHEQNQSLIVEAEDDFPISVPNNYRWMTLNQLLYFIKFNNYLNIQSRSLISLITFI